MEHTVRCRFCRGRFRTKSNAAKTCPRCRPLLASARSAAAFEIKCGRLTEAQAAKFINERVRSHIMADGAQTTNGRCKFCGKTASLVGGFCYNCLRTGLDSVFEVTGRSNGWENRQANLAPVQAGWRGQKCCGGGRSINKLLW